MFLGYELITSEDKKIGSSTGPPGRGDVRTTTGPLRPRIFSYGVKKKLKRKKIEMMRNPKTQTVR